MSMIVRLETESQKQLRITLFFLFLAITVGPNIYDSTDVSGIMFVLITESFVHGSYRLREFELNVKTPVGFSIGFYKTIDKHLYLKSSHRIVPSSLGSQVRLSNIFLNF